MKLEIACFDAPDAIVAAREGADRIELCADYSEGGISPDVALLKPFKKEFDTPVFVMIRPRGGDFVYTDEEFEAMKKKLIAFREAGADGFVFGILTAAHQINEAQNRKLVSLAAGKPCTFHRAFDRLTEKKEGLEKLISIGFKTVLTSGGTHPAMEGIDILENLYSQAEGRITILAGGGIRAANVHHFKKLDFVHSACVHPDTEKLDIVELKSLRARVSEL